MYLLLLLIQILLQLLQRLFCNPANFTRAVV